MAIYAFVDGNGRITEAHNVEWMTEIPVGAIALPENLWDVRLDLRWDSTQWLNEPIFILDDYKKAKIKKLKSERDSSLYVPFDSSATGNLYTYDLNAIERNEITTRRSLGVNGKVQCINASGVERRRNHTAAEISTLVTDMIAAIDAIYAAYEVRITNTENVIDDGIKTDAQLKAEVDAT